jgi:hypothetical protein
MILKNISIFFKIKQKFGKNINNPKGGSFKENKSMTPNEVIN